MSVPVKAIVGLVLYLTLTLLVIVILAVDKMPEYRPMLLTLLSGMVFATIIAAYSVYLLTTAGPSPLDPNARIKFDSCPDYWTEAWDASNKKRVCYNYQYDETGRENLIVPVVSDFSAKSNPASSLMSLDLTGLNNGSTTNDARCKIAKAHAWTEAYNSCIKYPAASNYILANTGVVPLPTSMDTTYGLVPSFQSS